MSKTAEIQKLLAIALAEVGYLEKKTNSQLDDKTANAGYNNYTKYARDLANAGYYNGNKNGYAWCDVFVDWCFFKLYGKDKGQEIECQTGDCGAGCYYSAQYYKAQNRFSTTPEIGDQIFFLDSAGDVGHTGLVYKVDSTTVYTVEGNTSSASGVVANGGGVAKKSYARTYSKIYGYGHPKYPETAETTTGATTTAVTDAATTGKYTVGWNRDNTGWWYADTVNTYYKSCTAVIDGTAYLFNSYGYVVIEPTSTGVVRTWKNGSTDEPVYADTKKKTKIGSLNPYESCDCIGEIDGMYIVRYKVDNSNYYKVGVVAYSGGL